MSITNESELIGMQKAGEAVAYVLREMIKYAGKQRGDMAQHEHTIIVTDRKPIILTEMNGILN